MRRDRIRPRGRERQGRWENGMIRDSEVFIFQGETRRDLLRTGQTLLRRLNAAPALAARDVAFTLNCPLHEGSCRLALIAASCEELREKLAFALSRLAEETCARIQDRTGVFYFDRPLYREG